MMTAKVKKLLENKTCQGNEVGFWVFGETTGPTVGYSCCVNPVRMASDPDKFKGTFDFFVTNPVQKMMKTSWGYIFRCRDGIWIFTWE